MLDKLKKIIYLLLNPKLTKQLLSMSSTGYLYEIGWIESFKKKLPLSCCSKPLPWVTYSFIDFIADRLHFDLEVFEYGSGNSTLWYSSKVKSVTSVEHDINWFQKIKDKMPDNVNIYHEKLVYGGSYSEFSNKFGKKFDIVIVDGRDRINCMRFAVRSINDK